MIECILALVIVHEQLPRKLSMRLFCSGTIRDTKQRRRKVKGTGNVVGKCASCQIREIHQPFKLDPVVETYPLSPDTCATHDPLIWVNVLSSRAT